MYVWSQSPKYICPKCRNKIPMADLEAIYRDRLTEIVMSPDQITAHAEAADETVREKQGLIEAARAEPMKIETEDDRVYEAYIADEISKEDFGRRHRPLSERRDQFSQPEKRQLVETITDAITIAKEEVTIDLLYLPGSVSMQRGHAAALSSVSGLARRLYQQISMTFG